MNDRQLGQVFHLKVSCGKKKSEKFSMSPRHDLIAVNTKKKDNLNVVKMFACKAQKIKTKAGWHPLSFSFESVSSELLMKSNSLIFLRFRLHNVINDGVKENTTNANSAPNSFETGDRLIEYNGRSNNNHYTLSGVRN